MRSRTLSRLLAALSLLCALVALLLPSLPDWHSILSLMGKDMPIRQPASTTTDPNSKAKCPLGYSADDADVQVPEGHPSIDSLFNTIGQPGPASTRARHTQPMTLFVNATFLTWRHDGVGGTPGTRSEHDMTLPAGCLL